MRINSILSENVKAKQRLIEDPDYKKLYNLGRLLKEADLTQDQVKQAFQRVADGAAAGANTEFSTDDQASNRTLLGKGVDVAGKVSSAFKDVGNWIGNSGPVAGLDAMIDQAQKEIMSAAGGDAGKVQQALDWYRELSKVPGMALAIKAIIVGLAGLAGSGLGPVGIAAGLTFANKMLQGNKFSSAVGSALATGGTVAAMHVAKDLLADAPDAATTEPDAAAEPEASQDLQLPDADAEMNAQADVDAAQQWLDADEAGKTAIEQATGMPAAQLQDIAVGNSLQPTGAGSVDMGGVDAGEVIQHTVTKGETLSQIAKANGVSVEELQAANPEITDVHKIAVGQNINIPAETGSNVYANGVGAGGPTASSTMPQAQADELSGRASNISAAQQAAEPAAAPVAEPSTDFAQQARNQVELNKMVQDKVDTDYANQQGAQGNYVPTGNAYIDRLNRAAANGIRLRESYIDRDMTIRMWVLREGMGKPRGGVQITESGRKAIFRAIAKASLNEGALDKLKSFNQQAGAAIGKATAPLKRIAAAGADAATNNITYDKLDMNWRRGAKLAGAPTVNSEDLVKFLRDQGVKDNLINSVFADMNIPLDKSSQAANATKGGFLSSLLKGAGAQQAGQAVDSYNAASTGGAKAPPADASKTAGAAMNNLRSQYAAAQQPAATPAPAATAQATPAPTATASKPTPVTGSTGFDYASAAKMAGIKPAAPKAAPNFGQQMGGYGKTTTTVNTTPTVAKPVAAAQPKQPKVVSGGATPAEVDAYNKKVQAAAAAQPAMAESKIDIAETLWRKMKRIK
jgi:LysM repeat protein